MLPMRRTLTPICVPFAAAAFDAGMITVCIDDLSPPQVAPIIAPAAVAAPLALANASIANENPGASLSPATAPVLQPLIYVVDDEIVNLRVASRYLKAAGAAYQLFEDGADLPQLPFPPNVQAVFLDIVMKRSDGVSVCSALRAGGCTVPILAMTGNVSRCASVLKL